VIVFLAPVDYCLVFWDTVLFRHALPAEAWNLAILCIASFVFVSPFEHALMVWRVHLLAELDVSVFFFVDGLQNMVKTHLWSLVAGGAVIELAMRVVVVSALDRVPAEVARVIRSARRIIFFGWEWREKYFIWVAFDAAIALLVCSNAFKAFPTAPVFAS